MSDSLLGLSGTFEDLWLFMLVRLSKVYSRKSQDIGKPQRQSLVKDA